MPRVRAPRQDVGGNYFGQVSNVPHRLIQACESARCEGKDFPTIWRNVLRPHSLVVGLPRHEIVAGQAAILVNLRNGQTLISTVDGFSLRWM